MSFNMSFKPALFAACLVFPSAALSQCSGEDLRATLTAPERAILDARTQSQPYATGNLWRAEMDGETIYIVGTLHLDDPRLSEPMARIEPLIAQSGRVLLEMTETEEAQLSEAMSSRPEILLLPDTTLPELMAPAQWQAVSQAVDTYGIPPFVAAKFRPWYLMMLLSTPPCAMDQLAAMNGLDARIKAAAQRLEVPTEALEPYDTAFRLLNAEPLDDQVDAIEFAVATQTMGEDVIVTTLDSYFEQSHAEIWQLTSVLMARSDRYSAEEIDALIATSADTLLTQRNVAWIPVILNAARTTQKPILAAFGAAHLAGENGVLKLLEEQGFSLTRLPF